MSAETRERVLAAAAEVFAERGYEGAGVSDIARRAGFTTGAIYGRFRDKAQLLLEVVQASLEAQQEAAVVASQAGGGDLPAQFAELAGELVDRNQAATRALVLEAHVAARRDRDVGEVLRHFQQTRLDALRQLVEDGQARGDIDADLDAATVATLFVAIPLGLVLLDAAGIELPTASDWANVAEHTAAALRPRRSGRTTTTKTNRKESRHVRRRP